MALQQKRFRGFSVGLSQFAGFGALVASASVMAVVGCSGDGDGTGGDASDGGSRADCVGADCSVDGAGGTSGDGSGGSVGSGGSTSGDVDGPMGPGEYANDCAVEGDFRLWHKVSIVCDGPAGNESPDSDEDEKPDEGASTSTFMDNRMTVTFTNGDEQIVVPGHFAADGDAGNSGAATGAKWRAHLMPPTTGKWTYSVSFRTGDNVAVSTEVDAGSAVAGIDGAAGAFDVAGTDKTGRDMRAHGLLEHLPGERYLRHRGTGRAYVEGGADSPENIFGFHEFDNTTKHSNVGSCKGILHKFEAHAADWSDGDPSWDGGKGKALIGVINYLASTGINAIYLVANSKNGDGCDGHPWSHYFTDFHSYDVSKLDQWEMAFSHMTQQGMLIHFLTQETENDHMINGGDLGNERKLYYREIISRFGHHPALQWNLGEENTNTAAQRRDFTDYIKASDPYDHAVLMHTYPGDHDHYDDFLGYEGFDGPTLQYGAIPSNATDGLYGETVDWIEASSSSDHGGLTWVVTATEASGGDAPYPYKEVSEKQRVYWMYANTMAGGGGIEWYLKNDGSHAYDLAVENQREFDNLWNETGVLVEFFNETVPGDGVDLGELSPNNGLVATNDAWVLAEPGNAYIVFLRDGDATTLDATGGGSYQVSWINPRTGAVTDVTAISGEADQALGSPPTETNQDWLVWVRR